METNAVSANELVRLLLLNIPSQHYFQTIVKNFHLDKDLDTITGSWDDIVKNYREIEDEIKKHGQENSAKIFTDGSAFDKVLFSLLS